MSVELVKTLTSDGLRLDGALYSPQRTPVAGPIDAAIFVHGVGGNFYGSPLFDEFLAPLASHNIAVLRINTRGHDGLFTANTAGGARRFGAAFEIVDECRLDLAAWRQFLEAQGFQRIALVGHSLGAVKSIYALAHRSMGDCVRLAALSPPRLCYSVYHKSGDSAFREAMVRAETLVADGRPDELMQVRFPFPLIISARSYVDKYGREERYDIVRRLPQVTCPTLFVYGEQELAEGRPPFAGIDRTIRETAGADQRLEVRVVAGADHFYNGVQAPTAELVVRWLTRDDL